MKNIICVLFFLITNCIYSQVTEQPNIYLQEFRYSSKDCYTNNKSDLIFYTKYYSNQKIKLGNLSFNDSLIFSKLKHTIDRYSYWVKREYSKDTLIGKYNPKKYSLINNIKYKSKGKLLFKDFQKQIIQFECDDLLYDNVVLIKSFFLTHVIITKDEKKRRYKVKLIKENCQVVYEEDYDYDLKYCKKKNFLALKYKGNFIFVFDKFLF